MTDGSGEQTTPRTRQFMSSTVATQPTIPEEPSGLGAIANLVTSTPLIDPERTSIQVQTPDIPHRPRRRSSLSVLQSLLSINHSIPNKDIRKRYEWRVRRRQRFHSCSEICWLALDGKSRRTLPMISLPAFRTDEDWPSWLLHGILRKPRNSTNKITHLLIETMYKGKKGCSKTFLIYYCPTVLNIFLIWLSCAPKKWPWIKTSKSNKTIHRLQVTER